MWEEREPFVARPHKIRRIVIPVAVLLLVAFTIVGLLLKHGSTGAHFGTSDQVAMVALGVVLAAAALLPLRPRVRANTHWIEVRNVLGAQRYDWSAVRGISFPDGAPWARLELPADEYVPVMAIQAGDGERAVIAMRELRGLYRDAAGSPR